MSVEAGKNTDRDNRLTRYAALGTAIFVISALALTVFATASECTRDAIILDPFSFPSAPNDLTGRGYTGDTVALMLIDKLQSIASKAQTLKKTETFSHGEMTPNVKIGETGFTLDAVVRLVRTAFKIPERHIFGEVTQQQGELAITIWFSGHAISSGMHSDLSAAVDDVAAQLMIILDPYVMARYLYEVGRTDDALKLLIQSISERPDEMPWAWNLWGGILAEKGHLEEAIHHFRIAEQSVMKTDSIGAKLGILSERDRQILWITHYNWGRAVFQRATEGDINPSTFAWMEESENQFTKVIQWNMGMPNTHVAMSRYMLGLVLFWRCNNDAAATNFRAALAADPTLSDALVYLGYISVRNEKFEEAQDLFDQAIAANPGPGNDLAWRTKAGYRPKPATEGWCLRTH